MGRIPFAMHTRFGLLVAAFWLGGCSAAQTSPVGSGPPPPVSVTVSVSVSPSAPTPDACGTVAFQATVSGTTNQGVTWSVLEGSAGGTISAAGVYTAPATPGSYHVVATSQADVSKSSAVPVVVGAERVLSVSVNPATISVAVGGTAQFTASITTSCGTTTAASLVAIPDPNAPR